MAQRLEQKQMVRDHFDKVSTVWGNLYSGEVSFENYNFIIRKKHVLDLFDKSGGNFLDAGCGTGDFIPDLLDRGGEVYALDFAQEMIEQSRSRMAAHPLAEKVHFSVGDVTNLEFQDNFFDAIIGVGLVEYILDVESSLRQMYRVLKPGGNVIITVPNVASPFMAYETLVPKCKRVVKRALAYAGLRKPERTFLHRHFFPWQLDWQLKRVGFKKQDFAFCTYGTTSTDRLESFSLDLSRRLDKFGRSPVGILGTNYIVKAEKPESHRA